MDTSDFGTLKGLANILKGAGTPAPDAGTAKLPLALFPTGVKPGQRVSLTVSGVDPVSGMVTVIPDAMQEAVPPAPVKAQEPVVGKDITMGPMDGLRSYLFQKTQEQESQ